ncbi:hypothetical protein NDU88_002827 [Pleurodeles waltl]|uniref:Uncharacterized protein n=1 Tax=Pleurodeles waltl TaxID=8319 RepID=A0AAV7WPQ9_PLEWA|nr:hypothetical protein NDU88_002827 [Pleurodeles waltl]
MEYNGWGAGGLQAISLLASGFRGSALNSRWMVTGDQPMISHPAPGSWLPSHSSRLTMALSVCVNVTTSNRGKNTSDSQLVRSQ